MSSYQQLLQVIELRRSVGLGSDLGFVCVSGYSVLVVVCSVVSNGAAIDCLEKLVCEITYCVSRGT